MKIELYFGRDVIKFFNFKKSYEKDLWLGGINYLVAPNFPVYT